MATIIIKVIKYIIKVARISFADFIKVEFGFMEVIIDFNSSFDFLDFVLTCILLSWHLFNKENL